MKVSFFPALLFTLIMILLVKAVFLTARVSEETNYALDTSATSVLVDTAYASQSEIDSKIMPKQNQNNSSENKSNEVSVLNSADRAPVYPKKVETDFSGVDNKAVSLLDQKLNMNKSELKLLK